MDSIGTMWDSSSSLLATTSIVSNTGCAASPETEVELVPSIGDCHGVGLAQPSRAGTFTGGLIVRVEQGAFAQGQAAAADAAVEGALQCFELADATCHCCRPLLAHVSPFALGGRAIGRQLGQRGGYFLQSQPNALARGNYRKPPERVARELALVTCCHAVLNQAALVVVANGRHADARSSSEVADR